MLCLPLGYVVKNMYMISTYPTQEPCAGSYRSYGSQPVTRATTYRSSLKNLDLQVGMVGPSDVLYGRDTVPIFGENVCASRGSATTILWPVSCSIVSLEYNKKNKTKKNTSCVVWACFSIFFHGSRPTRWSRQFSNSRVESGRVGSGRVGSGRVGSGRVGSGRVGSGQCGSVRVRK